MFKMKKFLIFGSSVCLLFFGFLAALAAHLALATKALNLCAEEIRNKVQEELLQEGHVGQALSFLWILPRPKDIRWRDRGSDGGLRRYIPLLRQFYEAKGNFAAARLSFDCFEQQKGTFNARRLNKLLNIRLPENSSYPLTNGMMIAGFTLLVHCLIYLWLSKCLRRTKLSLEPKQQLEPKEQLEEELKLVPSEKKIGGNEKISEALLAEGEAQMAKCDLDIGVFEKGVKKEVLRQPSRPKDKCDLDIGVFEKEAKKDVLREPSRPKDKCDLDIGVFEKGAKKEVLRQPSRPKDKCDLDIGVFEKEAKKEVLREPSRPKDKCDLDIGVFEKEAKKEFLRESSRPKDVTDPEKGRNTAEVDLVREMILLSLAKQRENLGRTGADFAMRDHIQLHEVNLQRAAGPDLEWQMGRLQQCGCQTDPYYKLGLDRTKRIVFDV